MRPPKINGREHPPVDVWVNGQLVAATPVPGGWQLPDGTIVRWLVW